MVESKKEKVNSIKMLIEIIFSILIIYTIYKIIMHIYYIYIVDNFIKKDKDIRFLFDWFDHQFYLFVYDLYYERYKEYVYSKKQVNGDGIEEILHFFLTNGKCIEIIFYNGKVIRAIIRNENNISIVTKYTSFKKNIFLTKFLKNKFKIIK